MVFADGRDAEPWLEWAGRARSHVSWHTALYVTLLSLPALCSASTVPAKCQSRPLLLQVLEPSQDPVR